MCTAQHSFNMFIYILSIKIQYIRLYLVIFMCGHSKSLMHGKYLVLSAQFRTLYLRFSYFPYFLIFLMIFTLYQRFTMSTLEGGQLVPKHVVCSFIDMKKYIETVLCCTDIT
jgi:hypothetical protein